MDIEVALVEEDNTGNFWNIIGTAGMNESLYDSFNKYLKASRNALLIIKSELSKGNSLIVAKNLNHAEIYPSDLVIIKNNHLDGVKKIALNNIINLINQNIFNFSVINAMDYLNCYMKLLSAGIFISDKNREDKYFEIIEAAQECEEPSELTENSTFEEEQKYIEQKKKYEAAQDNLNTLEKYLNAYDKISKVNFVNTLLNEMREKVLNANSEEEVKNIMDSNKKIINQYFHPRNVLDQQI